jgi:hypothetical protein
MSMDPHLTPEQEQREEQFFDQTWWEIPLSPDVVKFFQGMGANWDRRINIVCGCSSPIGGSTRPSIPTRRSRL